MSHDTSLALELFESALRPATPAPRRGLRFILGRMLRRAGSDTVIGPYQRPLDRVDRLHVEYRPLLGRF